jgi:hypothetical protein
LTNRSLYPLYSKLGNIYRELEQYKKTGCYDEDDLLKIHTHIAIFQEYCTLDSKFLDSSIPENEQVGDRVPFGQACLSSLWERIHRLLAHLSEHDSVDPELTPLRKELVRISRQLTVYAKSQHELHNLKQIQIRLDKIDASKNSIGVWKGTGNTIPAGQVCLLAHNIGMRRFPPRSML